MADLDNLQTFYSLFSQWRFHIPDYQRGYAWGEDQWKALMDDLSTLTDHNDHFTGLLVLHENDDPTLRVKAKGIYKDVYDIVDGQQRMTTLVILLDEIRRAMEEINDGDLPDIAESIADTYLYESGSGGVPVLKLILDRNNEVFFTHNILHVNGADIAGAEIQSHKNLQGAQTYFRSYLNEKAVEKKEEYPIWLENLYGKISNQMKVMVYKLRSEADAGVVFESMNNRGKKPNHLDLVKNYLLYLASKLGPELNPKLTEEINRTWEVIFRQLAAAERADDEEALLQMHWFTIYDHDQKHWNNEKEKSDLIKKRFSLLNYIDRYDELFQSLLNYVHTLSNAAVAYSDLRMPDHAEAFKIYDNNKDTRTLIVKYSQKLLRLNILRSFQPLLIAVRLTFPDDAKKYLEMVKLCELYAFRLFAIAEKRINSKEAVLFRLANQLFNQRISFTSVCESIQRDLLSACPDSLFQQSFSAENPTPWYGKRGLKYFLYEYEEFLYGAGEPKIKWESIYSGREKTIEHILPQTPQEGGYWTDHFSQEEREKFIHQIGNLTLTEDNLPLGNKPFPEKKGVFGQEHPCYANSNLKIERELAVFTDWTPQHIEQRQQRLAKWALDRWHVDPPPKLPDDAFEALKKRAVDNGFGDEFMRLHDLALRLGLKIKANKNRMSYKSPRNYLWSVIKVYTYASGIDLSFNFQYFPKYAGVTEVRIREIFDNQSRWWLPRERINEFFSRLEQLAEEVESNL